MFNRPSYARTDMAAFENMLMYSNGVIQHMRELRRSKRCSDTLTYPEASQVGDISGCSWHVDVYRDERGEQHIRMNKDKVHPFLFSMNAGCHNTADTEFIVSVINSDQPSLRNSAENAVNASLTGVGIPILDCMFLKYLDLYYVVFIHRRPEYTLKEHLERTRLFDAATQKLVYDLFAKLYSIPSLPTLDEIVFARDNPNAPLRAYLWSWFTNTQSSRFQRLHPENVNLLCSTLIQEAQAQECTIDGEGLIAHTVAVERMSMEVEASSSAPSSAPASPLARLRLIESPLPSTPNPAGPSVVFTGVGMVTPPSRPQSAMDYLSPPPLRRVRSQRTPPPAPRAARVKRTRRLPSPAAPIRVPRAAPLPLDFTLPQPAGISPEEESYRKAQATIRAARMGIDVEPEDIKSAVVTSTQRAARAAVDTLEPTREPPEFMRTNAELMQRLLKQKEMPTHERVSSRESRVLHDIFLSRTTDLPGFDEAREMAEDLRQTSHDMRYPPRMRVNPSEVARRQISQTASDRVRKSIEETSLEPRDLEENEPIEEID